MTESRPTPGCGVPEKKHNPWTRPYAVANSLGLVDNQVFAFEETARKHALSYPRDGWVGECWVVRLVPAKEQQP